MTCQKIYKAALRLLNETAPESVCAGCSEEYDEFAERAPYLLAAAVTEAGEVDDEYRRSHGLAARGETDTAEIPLETDFPLSPRFAPAVAFYLASMLIADENPELSDTLFDRFCDAMSTIKASIPSVKSAIRNVYPAP